MEQRPTPLTGDVTVYDLFGHNPGKRFAIAPPSAIRPFHNQFNGPASQLKVTDDDSHLCIG